MVEKRSIAEIPACMNEHFQNTWAFESNHQEWHCFPVILDALIEPVHYTVREARSSTNFLFHGGAEEAAIDNASRAVNIVLAGYK